MNNFRNDLQEKPEIKLAVPVRKYMMCLNESSLNPLDILNEQIAETMQKVKLNKYVSEVTPILLAKLAEYVGYGVKDTQILFGNGVDDMLYFLFTAAREAKEDYCLSLAPSYFDYKIYSGSVGLEMVFLPFHQNFDFSEEEYLEKLNHPNCKLGIICNPNNPTGHLIPAEKIIYILKNTQKPILVDETYFEFSGITFMDKLADFPNMIISRSFSKSFSAAGLRFGYLISSPENIKYLNKVIPVFNTSILTQAIALTILENPTVFAANNAAVINEKENMYKKMKSFQEVIVHPSHTNFLTFSLGDKSTEFFNFLLQRDISIRPVGGHSLLANHLRVTVCDAISNSKFLEALQDFIQKKG